MPKLRSAANGSEAYHEGALLLGRLEAAMAKLRGCVDEFQLNRLQGPPACVHQKRLEWGESFWERRKDGQQQHPLQ